MVINIVNLLLSFIVLLVIAFVLSFVMVYCVFTDKNKSIQFGFAMGILTIVGSLLVVSVFAYFCETSGIS
jgi:type II secretory pathway component PulF